MLPISGWDSKAAFISLPCHLVWVPSFAKGILGMPLVGLWWEVYRTMRSLEIPPAQLSAQEAMRTGVFLGAGTQGFCACWVRTQKKLTKLVKSLKDRYYGSLATKLPTSAASPLFAQKGTVRRRMAARPRAACSGWLILRMGCGAGS